jgi:hypothetical protein
VESVSVADVVSKCASCTGKSLIAKDLMHAADCKAKKVSRACEH